MSFGFSEIPPSIQIPIFLGQLGTILTCTSGFERSPLRTGGALNAMNIGHHSKHVVHVGRESGNLHPLVCFSCSPDEALPSQPCVLCLSYVFLRIEISTTLD